MLFNYKAIDNSGAKKEGSIEAVTVDVAIESLQKRGLIIVDVEPAVKETWTANLHFGSGVSNKDVVMLSRQMATLFEAQVSALKIFTLLSAEIENHVLQKSMDQIAIDLQAGSSISKALEKHPQIFSDFYVNMVRAGEETGKLDETFNYLADHLDRTYEVTTKAKNALVYPAFVITVFIAVMSLMFTVIIPKIGSLLKESTTEIPVYTKIVLSTSDFFVNYGLVLAALLIIGGFFGYRYTKT